jgi:hypothetical protein
MTPEEILDALREVAQTGEHIALINRALRAAERRGRLDAIAALRMLGHEQAAEELELCLQKEPRP